MDAETQLQLINERHAEARHTAAMERLAASIATDRTRPPRGPLAWALRATAGAATAIAAAGAVLRAV
jgi:hypothetical protein